MLATGIIGRGVDTLVLNVCYADKQFQPIKQELDQNLRNELNILQGEARENEAPTVTIMDLQRHTHVHARERFTWTMALDVAFTALKSCHLAWSALGYRCPGALVL